MVHLEIQKGRTKDLILLGRVAIDLNPIDHFKPLSESETFKRYLGGSPANIAVGASRHGLKVGFLGRVSDDQFGDFALNYFEKEGIDTSYIKRCEHGENLGLTFTEILSPAESQILMYRKGVADLQLSMQDIEEEYIKDAKVLLISGTSLSASPSREAALKALALAKKHKTIVVFDIDFRNYTWKHQEDVAVYYGAVGQQADMIIGSREEFDLMEQFLGSGWTDEQSAHYWQSKGASIVVIKHGKEGSRAYLAQGEAYQVDPFPVQLLKSFGGGDGYASGLLYGLLTGWDISRSLEFGSAQAAMMVGSHSCSEDLPGTEQVEAFIKKAKQGVSVEFVKELPR